MPNNKSFIQLSAEQRETLKKTNMASTSEKRLCERSGIILSAEGRSFKAAARLCRCSWPTVAKWCNRFKQHGLAGLSDAMRSGRPDRISASVKARILSIPETDHDKSSCRKVARSLNVSASTVNRIWRSNGIKPHLIKSFKLSNDPKFEEKFWDVIGVYLNPPEKAMVLCCDEKTQIQALERTQPGLPLGIGHVRTETHDYYRHGTTTLFAALNYLDGKIISRLDTKHTHAEWLAFLKKIDKDTPRGCDLHLIVDNYATHKHAEVNEWLKKHTYFHLHFTPTGSSWMNLVERFFRDLTDQIRTESFPSLMALTNSIINYLDQRNESPKRYVWHKTGEKILAKIDRARRAQNAEKH